MKLTHFIFTLSALTLPATAAIANLTWDITLGTAGAQDGTGTWNTGLTNWWDGASNVAFASGDNVTIGAASGAAGTITVDAGGVTAGSLTFNAPGSSSYTISGGSITGGALIKNGANGLRFDNANTFTSVTINAGPNSASDGAIRLGNANALGTSAITLNNSATMTALYFLGGFGTSTLSNNITFASGAVQTNLLTTAAISQTVTLSGVLSGGNSGATIYLNNNVSAGVSKIKVTNTSNTVLGKWQINRGALEFTSDAALGDLTNDIVLDVTSSNAGTGLTFGANNITLNSGRSITVTSNTIIDTGSFTGSKIDGAIAINGQLIKRGTGDLTLTSANTGNSTVLVDAGTVKLGNAASLGTTTGGTTITAGAVLDLNGQTVGAEAVTVNGTGISSGGALINSNTTTAASLSGAVTLGANSSAGGAGNVTLSGVVGGAFTLTKVGAGSLTLSNANTYSATTITSGPNTQTSAAVIVGNNAALGSGAVTLNNTSNITALYNGATSRTITNNIALSSTAGLTTRFLAGNATTFELDGVISGGSATSTFLVDTNQGAGSTGLIKLTGTNTFQGKIQLNRGGLAITSDAALGDAANSIFFDIGTNTQVGLRFDAAMSSARSIQLGGGKQVFDTNGNNVTLSGVVSGTGELHKSGAGTLTLSNSNTYSGLTNITAGTLALSGSASLASTNITVGTGTTFDVSAVTGGFTLASGQTLTGTGTIVGNATVASGGTVTPASTGVGALNYGDNLSLLGTVNLDVTGITLGSYDRLIGDGANILTLGGQLNLNNTGYTPMLGDQITVFPSWSSITGSFSSIVGTDLGGGLSWDTSTLASNGMLTVVPEPAAALLGGIGMLALLRRRRS